MKGKIIILHYVNCILGTDLVSKLLKMQQLEDEDELAYSSEDSARLDTPAQGQGDGRPSWMITLHNSASTWLQLLPRSLVVKFIYNLFFLLICFEFLYIYIHFGH